MALRRKWLGRGLALGATLTACSAGWRPTTVPEAKQPRERVTYELRIGSSAVRLHAVQFGVDSLSGVPWVDHANCSECRKSYAYRDITGARIGNPGAGASLLGIVVLGSLAIALSWLISPPHLE